MCTRHSNKFTFWGMLAKNSIPILKPEKCYIIITQPSLNASFKIAHAALKNQSAMTKCPQSPPTLPPNYKPWAFYKFYKHSPVLRR